MAVGRIFEAMHPDHEGTLMQRARVPRPVTSRCLVVLAMARLWMRDGDLPLL